jgi:hypothetical protein
VPELESELGPETYAADWQHSKILDLEDSIVGITSGAKIITT